MRIFDQLWAEEVDGTAGKIRLRVFQHTVEQRGGYLSQACSAGQILAALYHGLMRLPEMEAISSCFCLISPLIPAIVFTVFL